MITETTNYRSIITRLPEAAVVTFQKVAWDEYEQLLEQFGEASGLRISYNDGTLKVMTLSPEHEKYVRFIEGLITAIILRLRINIVSFGSATMRKRKRSKGSEPDACFYVQTAAAIGNRINLDFAIDPPPDVVVEVDIHHDSRDHDSIYAGLGVPEVWRYDGQNMSFHHLHQDGYIVVETSIALPMLTSQLLTDSLKRLQHDGELNAIMAFDGWLQSLPR